MSDKLENLAKEEFEQAPLIPPKLHFNQEFQTNRVERQDAAVNRQKVLEAARKLFAEHGVEAVTMKDIALEAGVGKGTLYRRYQDKAALCLALASDATQQFQQEVLGGFGEAGRGLSPFSFLKLFFERLIEFNEREAPLLKPARDVGTSDTKEPYYNMGVYSWQKITVLSLLREAVTARECRPDLDLDYISDALLAPLQLDLYLYQRRMKGYTTQRISRGMLQLLQGIAL